MQESQQSSADFRFYIENHTRNPDDLSRKQVRIYQLYSRTTGKHVQILGKKINANGDDGGKYGMGELLCISPDTLASLWSRHNLPDELWCFLRLILTPHVHSLEVGFQCSLFGSGTSGSWPLEATNYWLEWMKTCWNCWHPAVGVYRSIWVSRASLFKSA